MEPTRSALVVASFDYHDSGLRQLRAPSRDAEALTRVLGDAEIGGFDVDVSVNEPQHVVRRKISMFFAERGLDDLLLLHFSCHGLKDDDGTLYFATTDTDIHHLDATAVPSDFVSRLMGRSRSRRIALFLDCCYSGAFSRGAHARAGDKVDVGDRFGGRGQVVITASNAMEYAFEGDELTGEGQPSVFTTALVDALETGAADRDADGLISVDELYDYVYDEVRRKTPNQSPHKWADVTGDLYIARNPRPVVEPAELPGHIRDAMENLSPAIRAGAVEDLGRLLGSSQRRLALAARLALEELADDDSRRVSTAAQALLDAQPADQPEEIPAALEPAPPVRAALEPAGPPPAAPPPVVPPPAAPPAVAPKAEPSAVDVPVPVHAPSDDSGPRVGRGVRVAAVLALVGAVATVVGWIAYWRGVGWDGVASAQYFAIQAIAVPVVLALAAARILAQRGSLRLAFGLILALGIQSTAGYWGLLGWSLREADLHGAEVVILVGGMLAFLGGVVGLLGLRGEGDDVSSPAGYPRTAHVVAALGFLGALLGLIALFVPWAFHPSIGSIRVADNDIVLLMLETVIAVPVAAITAGLLLRSSPRHGPTFVGLLGGFGLQTMLFWFGTLWLVVSWGPFGGPEAGKVEPRPGLAIGLAGGAVVLAAGVVLWRRIRSPRPAAAARMSPIPH